MARNEQLIPADEVAGRLEVPVMKIVTMAGDKHIFPYIDGVDAVPFLVAQRIGREIREEQVAIDEPQAEYDLAQERKLEAERAEWHKERAKLKRDVDGRIRGGRVAFKPVYTPEPAWSVDQ